MQTPLTLADLAQIAQSMPQPAMKKPMSIDLLLNPIQPDTKRTKNSLRSLSELSDSILQGSSGPRSPSQLSGQRSFHLTPPLSVTSRRTNNDRFEFNQKMGAAKMRASMPYPQSPQARHVRFSGNPHVEAGIPNHAFRKIEAPGQHYFICTFTGCSASIFF